jgi:hypothetical protein
VYVRQCFAPYRLFFDRLLFVGSPHNFAPLVQAVVAADITQAPSSDFTVAVTYHDDHRLDTDTFDNDDIILSGVSLVDLIATNFNSKISV